MRLRHMDVDDMVNMDMVLAFLLHNFRHVNTSSCVMGTGTSTIWSTCWCMIRSWGMILGT
jgi:hypothetical protein